jgi:hypothetical protein
MRFEDSKKDDWCSSSFWETVCPSLSIEGRASVEEACPSQPPVNHMRKRMLLRERGYALVDEQVFPPHKLEQIRQGIVLLHEQGFPASFILLFDVTWDVATIAYKVLQNACLESNAFQFDMLAWHITGEGFSPHRDRQPESAASSFVGEDAKFVTQWIALTPATPENSCLYMIPKDYDPGYLEGDVDQEDPLRRALPDKGSFQRIVCLPREKGQSILFTHRIIHWGSARDPHCDESKYGPRIAISFVCSDPTFEKPYLPKHPMVDGQRPPLRIRLLLVCAQLLIYYQRFNLPKDALRICYEYCKEMESELEDNYRKKVYVEFVKAMKEHEQGERDGGGDSDDEEAVLEAMLQAEDGGYGDDFVDDYDEDVGDEDEPPSGDDDEGRKPRETKRPRID